MPELPEVETIRRGLSPLIIGEVIKDVFIEKDTLGLLAGSLSLDDFKNTFIGSQIEELSRHGKY